MSGLFVLVVDDEPLARRRLIRMLAKLDWVTRVEQAGNVDEAHLIIRASQPDILLLDIQMPGASGFDLLEHLEPPMPVVVFVTAFDHHALRAFEANAVDYLTKPIEPGRFNLAMHRARTAASSHQQAERMSEMQGTIAALRRTLHDQPRLSGCIWVKVRGEHVRIPHADIRRIQAERDFVRIHVCGCSYLHHETLSALEGRLDPEVFIRIHRSCIVRCDAILRLKLAQSADLIAVLSEGLEIRVGRTFAPSLRKRLLGSSAAGGVIN